MSRGRTAVMGQLEAHWSKHTHTHARGGARTLLGQFGPWMLAALRLADQPQSDAESELCQQSSVFGVGNSPYLQRRSINGWDSFGRSSAEKLTGTSTSPRIRGLSPDRSKNLTASSPVTTPMFSVSAAWNNWPKTFFSSGVRTMLPWEPPENDAHPSSAPLLLQHTPPATKEGKAGRTQYPSRISCLVRSSWEWQA